MSNDADMQRVRELQKDVTKCGCRERSCEGAEAPACKAGLALYTHPIDAIENEAVEASGTALFCQPRPKPSVAANELDYLSHSNNIFHQMRFRQVTFKSI